MKCIKRIFKFQAFTQALTSPFEDTDLDWPALGIVLASPCVAPGVTTPVWIMAACLGPKYDDQGSFRAFNAKIGTANKSGSAASGNNEKKTLISALSNWICSVTYLEETGFETSSGPRLCKYMGRKGIFGALTQIRVVFWPQMEPSRLGNGSQIVASKRP